jgi:hypothetical protein
MEKVGEDLCVIDGRSSNHHLVRYSVKCLCRPSCDGLKPRVVVKAMLFTISLSLNSVERLQDPGKFERVSRYLARMT